MKLIIDIDDELYKAICVCDDAQILSHFAIKHGTPYEERPHGEWIPCKSTRTGQVTNIDYKCSKCSHHKDRPVPYCEICGSIMKRREGEAE